MSLVLLSSLIIFVPILQASIMPFFSSSIPSLPSNPYPAKISLSSYHLNLYPVQQDSTNNKPFKSEQNRRYPRRREEEQARHTQAPQVGTMNQAAGAQQSTSRLVRTNSSHQPNHTSSQRRTQLPQTTYSPFPQPKPLTRKPVSKERTDSPNSVLSFASNVPPPQVTHGRSRPFDTTTEKPTTSSRTNIPSRPHTPTRPITPSRPSSPSGSSIFRHFSPSRRGSNASTSSQRPPSRRGSISDSVRRVSADLRKGLDIIQMDALEREKWKVAEKARMHAEIEEQRRLDPSLRPAYQQEYLDWKATQTSNNLSPNLTEHERMIALDSALRPSAPVPLKKEAQRDRDAQAPRTAGEEIALLIAKSLDPLRTKRQGSADSSGMDFADCGAPVDVMESCRRCGRPVGGSEEEGLFLTGGFCPRCHRLRVKGQ